MRKNVILIVVAMKNELDVLLNKYNFTKKEIFNTKFYEGTINNQNVVCLLTGVGTINCAYSMGIATSNYNIKFIINYGISGAIGSNIHKNDFVLIDSCFNFSSFKTSCKEKGVDNYKWEYMTFVDNDIDKLIIYKSDQKLLNTLKTTIPLIGRCGSGDIWNREKDVLINLKNNYQVSVLDMECVSIYQIANKFSIPVISFKVISDNNLEKEEYDRNVLNNNIDKLLLCINKLIV